MQQEIIREKIQTEIPGSDVLFFEENKPRGACVVRIAMDGLPSRGLTHVIKEIVDDHRELGRMYSIEFVDRKYKPTI